MSCLLESGEDEEMSGGGNDGGGGVVGAESIFPDDDSNQILPVEQFFGNLDAMQVSLRAIFSQNKLWFHSGFLGPRY